MQPRKGILLLIKNTLSRQAVKAASKYIPIIGQVIAAGLGYGITSNIGNYYLDECHELARQILEINLRLRYVVACNSGHWFCWEGGF